MEKYNVPFREAHGRVGKLVKHLSSSEKVQHGQFSNLSAETLEKFLEVKITPKEISAIVNPQSVLDRRKAIGAPNPKLVSQAAVKRLGWISKHEDTLHSFEERADEASRELESAAGAIQSTGKTGKLSRR